MPGGILIIDKPEGWTSHDVVAKARGIFGEKRIGHGGTLDPMATGVLPLFIDRATRAVEFAEAFDKRYTACLRLGIVTDTQDTTGAVLERGCARGIDEGKLLTVLERFQGPQAQIPPMYSAVKVGGKKLYELARKGVETERRARDIEIFRLELTGRSENGDFILDVRCSKGTYVRTLCHDIGQALGCGGAMSGLRRTAAGDFTLDQAITLDGLLQAKQAGRHLDLLMPVDSLFRRYPACSIGSDEEKRCRNGVGFACGSLDPGIYRVYSESGEFLMLGKVLLDGLMSTVKSFFDPGKR